MAIIANTYQPYQSIGNREDLNDIISNVSPTETPFMSNAKGNKKPVSAKLTEWQTDALAAGASNAFISGDDLTAFAARVPTVRLGNYTQISVKSLIVADEQDAIDKAGRGKGGNSETNYQVIKAGAELKLDMEFALVQNNGGVAGATGTASQLAGIRAFMKTNVNMGTGAAANPTYTSGVANGRTDGTQRDLTETILKNVLQLGYTNGGMFTMVMVGPVNKQRVSTFTGIATRFKDVPAGQQAQIIGAADVYVGDFGQVMIVPSRTMRERDALFLDPKHYGVRYLEPMHVVQLARTGLAEKAAMAVNYTLHVDNEKAFGIAADLNVT